MRMSVSSFLVGTLAAGAVFAVILVSAPGLAMKSTAPWMEPIYPTKLEWLAMEFQAHYGESVLSSSSIIVGCYPNPEVGSVVCQIAYSRGTSASAVIAVEVALQTRMIRAKKVYPWAKLEIKKDPM